MARAAAKRKQQDEQAPSAGVGALPPLQVVRDWTKHPTKEARLPMASPEPGAAIITPTRDALRKALWEAPKEVRDAAVDTYVEQADDILATFTISTEDVDRPGDVIKQDGWDLTNYRRNPVVLFAHCSWDLPVATSIATYISRGVLKATARYTSEDIHEFGHTVGKLVANGFLPATSVGFRPLKWEVSEDEDRDNGSSWFAPVDFIESELLEWSNVPIPANPNALQDGKALEQIGINQREAASFVAWAERQLDGEVSLVVPRASLEEMLPPWRQLSKRARRAKVRAIEAPAEQAPPADPPPAEEPAAGKSEEAPESKADDNASLLRCPECGHEGPAADFEIGVEEDADAKALSSERLVRELRRRGLLVALMNAGAEHVARSDAPTPTREGPKQDRSETAVQRDEDSDLAARVRSLVRESVNEALLQRTGRLPP